MGEGPRSIAGLRHALAPPQAGALTPGAQARLWNDLGVAEVDGGNRAAAIDAFTRSLQLDPSFARAANNLGSVLRDSGNPGDLVAAAAAFAQATAVDARYALAWTNLGVTRNDLGDREGARAALERALECDPLQLRALLALAALERESSRLVTATALYRRAAAAAPADALPCLLLAGTLAEGDQLAAARAAYAEAERRDPAMLRAAVGRRLTLPMVAADTLSLQAARAAFAAGLASLAAPLPQRAATLSPARVLDEMRWTNFLLAYQGEDDRALQAAYATTIASAIDAAGRPWPLPAARKVAADRRLRVGFVSAFMRDGTVGRYFEHWITDLPTQEFEVMVYALNPERDALTSRIEARADAWRDCSRQRPSQIAPRVLADELDVLVYPELGMDATAFALSALRLAPRQCVAWGHPVTTGQPCIDDFLSCAAMEPPNAALHYTERLHTLPGIGTRYRMPVVPEDAARAAFGLPAAVPLLLCPQSLFKIHPDNDVLFARVLASVESSRLVVFEGRDPALTKAYLDRLKKAGIDLAGRVCVLPQCAHVDYLRLNRVCTVMLDTLRWSGGNTSLDAIACTLPMVTLPGRFMRGRQSSGMLRLIGCADLVARDEDDYVAIAGRLATDPAVRRDASERIAAGRSRIFDDQEPMAAFAAYLRS